MEKFGKIQSIARKKIMRFFTDKRHYLEQWSATCQNAIYLLATITTLSVTLIDRFGEFYSGKIFH